jgi:hypothetical protein
MPKGTGRFRRAIAALLALALLALPGAPLRHAAAPAPVGHDPAALHCGAHGAAAPSAQAAAVPADHHDHGQPCDDAGGAMPGLACCAAAQCPATLAGPPPPSAAPLVPPGPAPRFSAPVRSPHGMDVPPALPPPRRMA